jgi:hypothetical protein
MKICVRPIFFAELELLPMWITAKKAHAVNIACWRLGSGSPDMLYVYSGE